MARLDGFNSFVYFLINYGSLFRLSIEDLLTEGWAEHFGGGQPVLFQVISRCQFRTVVGCIEAGKVFSDLDTNEHIKGLGVVNLCGVVKGSHARFFCLATLPTQDGQRFYTFGTTHSSLSV